MGTESGKGLSIKCIEGLGLLKENPFSFKKSDVRPHIRLGRVNRHTSLLYEVGENKVKVLCFWNDKVQPFI